MTLHSKQIKTFGEGWEEEVPAILRSDMRNLTDTAQGDAGPMNLQQRVIQSGLDSIQGPDAPLIVQLFNACSIFAEDCLVSNKQMQVASGVYLVGVLGIILNSTWIACHMFVDSSACTVCGMAKH